MFYTLHRLVKWSFYALLLGLLFWAYQQREALEPVYAWHDVYQNGGFERTEPLPSIEGRCIAVQDGHTFHMMSGKRFFSVRLTGFETPQPPFSPEEIRLEKERREVLKEMLFEKQVRVEVTYSNQNSLLGVAYAAGTNLNTFFITEGLSRFNGDYVKSAPRDLQYKFFSAERAREREVRNTLASN